MVVYKVEETNVLMLLQMEWDLELSLHHVCLDFSNPYLINAN
jgi:hypothetical protein